MPSSSTTLRVIILQNPLSLWHISIWNRAHRERFGRVEAICSTFFSIVFAWINQRFWQLRLKPFKWLKMVSEVSLGKLQRFLEFVQTSCRTLPKDWRTFSRAATKSAWWWWWFVVVVAVFSLGQLLLLPCFITSKSRVFERHSH